MSHSKSKKMTLFLEECWFQWCRGSTIYSSRNALNTLLCEGVSCQIKVTTVVNLLIHIRIPQKIFLMARFRDIAGIFEVVWSGVVAKHSSFVWCHFCYNHSSYNIYGYTVFHDTTWHARRTKHFFGGKPSWFCKQFSVYHTEPCLFLGDSNVRKAFSMKMWFMLCV